ncbi:class I SAM-dependent methyltransferase [Bacteroides neonati]|uniref:class I SAM-dependent methyltransferase n=1 Tax=Bacteroides neonati TaxID=1347393 RepID=UPI0004B22848|nr:class I SAM-dependent methyltransferase [Bacteroides neonati]
MAKNKIYNPKEGYNIIAPYYDSWKWQKFWHNNEYPYIEKWCNTLSIGLGLDLGTGSGNNLSCFLLKGNKVDALDISSEMLKICKQKFEKYILNKSLKCLEQNVYSLPEYERKYDWIISNRVLSHIKHMEEIVKKMSHIIKYGGQCFISDIHPLHHYQYTNFTIKEEEIRIETYKHNIEYVTQQFIKNGFEVIKFKEVSTNDLINGDIIRDFPQLLNQETPIFYYLILRYKG